MAKITSETRDTFKTRSQPYKDHIEQVLKDEKTMLNIIAKDKSGVAYKKIMLCEHMIGVATEYITINNLSVEILETKNNDALNEARKVLYKAIIYLEEVVTNQIDVQYSELEDKLEEISNMPLEKRFELIRKLGLCIKLLIDAFGENTKWRWSFVELQGRFATVCKNLIDMKQACKDYFDPSTAAYDNTVFYIRLIRKLLGASANGYRDRYELSTHRIDDMRLAIQYLVADRRIALLIGLKDEGEEIKKKAVVWKEKLDADHKAGIAN